MTADPTTPARPADPVVAFAVAHRVNLAYALLAAGLIALGVGVYFTYKAWPAATQAKEADKEKDPAADPDKPDLLKDKEKDAATLVGQSGHVLWAISGYMFGVVFIGVGLMLFAGVPKPTLSQQESDARIVVLALGGLSGLTLMIAAIYVLVSSFKDLVKWVDEQSAPEGAAKLVAALLVFLLGAGLAFLASQPARAEERNNPRLRRLVYGTNVALMAVLVLLMLVVGNVLAAVKVPARLDTTESGFHTLTLSGPTKEYLAGLSQPVTAYTTYPEDAGRIATDARRLLAAMHDANPEMFRVRYLSPTVNKNDIDTLRNRFPQADANLNGILLTVGEDEKQYSFIRTADLQEQDFSERRPRVTFQGERKVVGEMLFLSENKTRPVMYFLTGHGELDVSPAMPGGDPQGKSRPAAKLRAALEKSSVDVRPLALERTAPKVPDDAAIVVIADPRAAIPPEQVEALRKYMALPLPGGKKGKLIVMAGPSPNPDGTGVIDTNLGGLLADFGITLGGRYIYSDPDERQQFRLGYTDLIAGVTQEAADVRNPIAMEYLPPRAAILWNCQEVRPARTPPGGPFATKALFVTTPRLSWLEESPVVNAEKAMLDMLKSPDLIRQKNASADRGRVVAAVVSEGAAGRVIVFGSGDSFSDDPNHNRIVDLNARLLTLTVNWLRDRPPVANIATKPYGLYLPNEKTSEVQVFWLPVGVTLMGVIALGLGVWVFRRK